jgi:hypothetical protein
MSFRKPFRAPPVRLGPYHHAERRKAFQVLAAKVLGGAVAMGLAAGAVASSEGRARLSTLPVALGLARARPPQPGDAWSNCSEARAAGTAPIYYGEPGYRDGMDGDDDGIACEPYRGR